MIGLIGDRKLLKTPVLHFTCDLVSFWSPLVSEMRS